MCESSAFVLGKNNELTRVMENVVNVNPVNGRRKNIRWIYKRNKINGS